MDATMTDVSGSDNSSAITVRSDGSSIKDDHSDDLAGGTEGEHHGTTANLNEEEIPESDDESEVSELDAESAIDTLNRHSCTLERAFEALAIIALSDYAFEGKEVSRRAWRDCWRMYNTFMVLYHGKGDLSTETSIVDFHRMLAMEGEDLDLKGRLGELDEEVTRFACDPTMDLDDLRYRFPVTDPTLGYWEMRISNLGFPHDPRFQRNQSGNHGGPITSPDYVNMEVTGRRFVEREEERHRRLGTTASRTVCPWVRISRAWEPCGETCRAVAREEERARALAEIEEE